MDTIALYPPVARESLLAVFPGANILNKKPVVKQINGISTYIFFFLSFTKTYSTKRTSKISAWSPVTRFPPPTIIPSTAAKPHQTTIFLLLSVHIIPETAVNSKKRKDSDTYRSTPHYDGCQRKLDFYRKLRHSNQLYVNFKGRARLTLSVLH